MRWDVQIESNDQQPYSTTSTLTTSGAGMQPFAYCLPRYARLDGQYINAPDIMPVEQNGYISGSLSDGSGTFHLIPKITVKYDRLKTSNGVKLIFHMLSGDYAKRLKIRWFKDDTLIKEQEFFPDGADYFCQAKVKLFNSFEISFLETNKPHRYLWLSYIQNQRMSDAGGLKIVYDDIALGAREDSIAASNDKRPFVQMENFKSAVEYPDYGMCLPRYAKLDGQYVNAPDTLQNMGYVSNSVSDALGVFAAAPVIVFSFGHNYSSVGITLRFNDYSGDYCKKVRIRWYSDSTLLKEETYHPTDMEYFCYGVVDFYNRVEISFLETSKPYRNAFLTEITWGLIRVFKDDEIKDIDCLMEIDKTSKEISINTMNFMVRDKLGYDFEFQKKQRQTLYFDEGILGIFYLKDGKQLSENRYSMEAHDAVGLLDGAAFMGGIYNHIKVKELLSSIMGGERIPFFMDDAYKDTTVSGYLPICSKRAALQQLAFAIGAVVDTSYDRNLYINPIRTEESHRITDEDLFTKLSFAHSDVITGVRLTAHEYLPGTEQVELFKGTLQGSIKVEFSEPAHSLTVQNGAIVSYGDNYAYISGWGQEVILTGKKYVHNTFLITKENEKVTHNKNLAEIKDATLVTKDNASQVLERIYVDCMNNESISCRILVGDHELGDFVELNTFKGIRKGILTSLNMGFSRNEITAEATIK